MANSVVDDQQDESSSRPASKRFGRSSSTRSNVNAGGSGTDGTQRDSDVYDAQQGSRGARLFRRLTLRFTKASARLPSLPPTLILDLDAGTAAASTAPRSPANPSPRQPVAAPTYSDSTTPAAAVIVQANASSNALPHSSRLQHTPQQRRKMVDAMANARLNVHQTHDLVRMCGRQIRERGLDSIGLFRPFRIAESHQRVMYMVQLFLLSVDASTYVAVFPVLPDNALHRLGTLPTSSAVDQSSSKSAKDELDKELRYASPHEVVSLLKWGLRHLRVRSSDFHSKDGDEWYTAFVAAERASGYHPRAIVDALYPRLPQDTVGLLSELLDLMSSVVAHTATNHMPASTLCYVLGFWVFGRIGIAHPPPSVDELLLAVDKSARITQHLLLAHIRAQAAATFAMPWRLTELVAAYPYVQSGDNAPSLTPAFSAPSVSTLRVDLRSENVVVSQLKPRTPGATLAAVLDAVASDSLQGNEGDTWASIMTHHYNQQSSRLEPASDLLGADLLLAEHARILTFVEKEIDERTKATMIAAKPQARPIAHRPRSSTNINDRPPQIPAFATTVPMSAPPSKLTFFDIAGGSAHDESMEVVVDEDADQHRIGRSEVVFAGGLEPSASWRSFSEEGFGAGAAGLVSTASSDLSLSDRANADPPLSPVKISPTSRQKTGRVLQRNKSSSSVVTSTGSAATVGRSGSRPALAHALTAPEPAARRAVTTTVTAIQAVSVPTAISIMWQDQLLDPSPCCSFPSIVVVRLNDAVVGAVTSENTAWDPDAWLMLVETAIPPRPPTPPYSPTKSTMALKKSPSSSGSRWDVQSQVSGTDRKSILAPSIRSVKSTLRRVSTVIGATTLRKSRSTARVRQPSHDSDTGSIFPAF